MDTKRVHSHQYDEFNVAEVHRSGIDVLECCNQGIPRSDERQIHCKLFMLLLNFRK